MNEGLTRGSAEWNAHLLEAKKDIGRAESSNHVLMKAVTEWLEMEGGDTREEIIASVAAMGMQIESDDLLLMWAALLVGRAEEKVSS